METELIRQARQTDLVAYLISRGEPLKRIGANYVHKDHDSLFIKGNMFTWYSRGKQGNSVDFLMLYYEMNFREAVEALTDNVLPTVENAPQKPVEASQRASDEKRVIGYLCKKRGLKTAYIVDLIRRGKLFQDIRGNCNFVICDWQEKSIGAEIVGTGDVRYKQVTSHSGFGFHIVTGKPTRALYFESAIDLLSCYQMYKDKLRNHILVSLGGLNSSVLYGLQSCYPDVEHWLCVDNDKAGDNFIAEMRRQLAIKVFRPPTEYKDWNEMLLSERKDGQ